MRKVIVEITRVLRQLKFKVASVKKIDAFLVELGYDLPFERLEEEFKEIHEKAKPVLTSIDNALESVSAVFKKGEDKDQFIAVLNLLYHIDEVRLKIEDFSKFTDTTFKAIRSEIDEEYREPFERVFNDEFVFEFNRRLIDYLWYTRLIVTRRKLFAVLNLLGLVEEVAMAAEPDRLQPKFNLKKIWWERIPMFLNKPGEVFDEVYQWDSEFNYPLFLKRLLNLVHAYGLPGGLYRISEEQKQRFQIPEDNSDKELRFPILHKGEFPEDYYSIDLNVFGLPQINQQRQQGIAATLSSSWGEVTIIPLGEEKELEIKAALNLDDGVGVMIEPEFEIEVYDAFEAGNAQPIGYDITIVYRDRTPEEGERIAKKETVLLGTKEGAKLAFSNYDITLNLNNQDQEKSISCTLNIHGGKVVLKAPDGDGFLSKIMGSVEVSVGFDLGLGLSSRYGFYFNGNAAMEITIPVHKQLGPIRLLELMLGINTAFSDDDFSLGLDFGVSAEIQLGPILAALKGLRVRNIFEKQPKNERDREHPNLFRNFPPVVVPPKIITLLIDASGVYGGGYLEIDSDNNRYAGILSLNLQAIELTAIALINTRLPNNKPGFSMLVSISVLFKPPIQLSFGFTLNGVGGLLGINRTMKVDALRERLASGAVESIMFPKDVIKNADRIISDLRAVFPPEDKHYVIAPFIRLGWGAPTNVEVDLGILLELPFKGRIILLGSVGIYLPYKPITDQDKVFTEIHIDVIGDFNFAEEYIRIDGRLRDSHIVGIPLTGGFAFMLTWDRQPQFLMSVGGYHPKYKKPERFPSVPRLAAILKKGSDLVMTCEAYMAITSNSFQIGWRADAVLKYKGATVKAHYGFNALLYFKPFFFEAEISMGVTVKYKGKRLAGVDFHFLLTGPKPWIVKGRAKVKVIGIKFKIKFYATWGGKQSTVTLTTGAGELRDEIVKELSDARAWSAKLPAHYESAELLRSIDEQEGTVLVHPAGYLEVRQTVAPLQLSIRKFGQSRVAGDPTFALSEARIGGQALDLDSPLMEYFARGQYEPLSDTEKIAGKDFERFVAGYAFGRNIARDTGPEEPVAVASGYESIVIDENLLGFSQVDALTPDWERSEGARPARQQDTAAYLSADKITNFGDEETFHLLLQDGTLLQVADQAAQFPTEAAANQYRKKQFPSSWRNYEIISAEEYELQTELFYLMQTDGSLVEKSGKVRSFANRGAALAYRQAHYHGAWGNRIEIVSEEEALLAT